jgi:CHAT domain-containing protein
VNATTAHALVATRGSARLVSLPASDAIRSACRALRLERPESDPAAAIADLQRLVVEPLKLPPAAKRVLVSPDGALSFVPFALLMPERDVVYEPSGTVHGLLLADAPTRGDGVLALGDPDYRTTVEAPPGADAMRARGGMRLTPLPASGAEAKAVGDVVLLGGEATETRLVAELAKRPRWRAVHLACHGLIDSQHPQRSALAIAADATSDGFLSVTDVFRMRIPADLVVLSACETGRGKVVRGEGIVGMTRAFMFAGVPRVLVSLWKVDDDATAALMRRFHEELRRGAPVVRGLREAQESVRTQERWKHPAYWAAWVLWGLAE